MVVLGNVRSPARQTIAAGGLHNVTILVFNTAYFTNSSPNRHMNFTLD
jgi:hypothetical protein